MPILSAKLLKYFDIFELSISVTSSQLSQIENAAAFETLQFEF